MKTSSQHKVTEIQPAIRFERYCISNLEFNIDERHWKDESASKELSLKMEFSVSHYDTQKKGDKELRITFNTKAFKEDNSFVLSFKAVAFFATSVFDIGDDDKTDALVNQSAPAIIFPYVRATISQLTQQCGFSPVILPVFNFTKSIKEVED